MNIVAIILSAFGEVLLVLLIYKIVGKWLAHHAESQATAIADREMAVEYQTRRAALNKRLLRLRMVEKDGALPVSLQNELDDLIAAQRKIIDTGRREIKEREAEIADIRCAIAETWTAIGQCVYAGDYNGSGMTVEGDETTLKWEQCDHGKAARIHHNILEDMIQQWQALDKEITLCQQDIRDAEREITIALIEFNKPN